MACESGCAAPMHARSMKTASAGRGARLIAAKQLASRRPLRRKSIWPVGVWHHAAARALNIPGTRAAQRRLLDGGKPLGALRARVVGRHEHLRSSIRPVVAASGSCRTA